MDDKILKYIEKLVKNENNFSYVDYGCDGMSDECCGNCGGDKYSETQTRETLIRFAKWLRKESNDGR